MWGYLLKGFRFIVVLGLLALAGQVFTSPNASVVPLSSCPGDFDGNGRVNIADFLVFIEAFGSRSGEAKYNAVMDIDGSGAIDVSDFLAFAEVFGTTCEKTSPEVLSDRAALVALYNATDGPNWVNNENWLTDAPLGEWYGVDTDASGRVVRLDLSGYFDNDNRAYVPHGLSGTIPPELGVLTNLTNLDLKKNNLTGPIPAELGGLSSLSDLLLFGNELSGAIPTELGDLASLTILDLADNRLSGSIPGRLGGLVNLVTLNLGGNELAGPLPAELGYATKLEGLDVRSNALTGSVPPEFGNLTLLNSLIFADNPGLSGPLPPGIASLEQLERFMAGETALCRPADSEFAAWFRAIGDRRLVRCEGGAAVYLTQSERVRYVAFCRTCQREKQLRRLPSVQRSRIQPWRYSSAGVSRIFSKRQGVLYTVVS